MSVPLLFVLYHTFSLSNFSFPDNNTENNGKYLKCNGKLLFLSVSDHFYRFLFCFVCFLSQFATHKIHVTLWCFDLQNSINDNISYSFKKKKDEYKPITNIA